MEADSCTIYLPQQHDSCAAEATKSHQFLNNISDSGSRHTFVLLQQGACFEQ
jgi:hypothetical protein